MGNGKTVAFVAGACVCAVAYGKWNDVDIKSRPVVAKACETVAGKAKSLLPPGKDNRWFGHFAWDYEEYEDGWCHYGVDWSPKGYTFYANGKVVGEQNDPVSHVPQFILVSTEPRGYRNVGGNDGGLTAGQTVWGRPDPELLKVPLPDTFEVDFVRVYDPR